MAHRESKTDTLLLTDAETAEITGICKRSVHNFSQSGLMPKPVKVGRCIRWRRDEIEAWVAGGCKPVSMTRARNIR